MNKPLLIVISGYPCTGKTYLGKLIQNTLNIPFLSKDSIAEIVFDSLDLQSSQWSRLHRGLAYNILYFFMDLLLSTNQSLVVESAFDPKFDNEKLRQYCKKYSLSPIQIYLKADKGVILDRFRNRSKDPKSSNKNNPVHFAYLSVDKLEEKIDSGKHTKLDFGADNYEFDTSDLSKVDYSKVFKKIKSRI